MTFHLNNFSGYPMANGIKRNACTLKVCTVLGVGWGWSQLKLSKLYPNWKGNSTLEILINLFSVSTVPPANMFGEEALYPDWGWCRLTLGWARYGTLHCPLHCAHPPGESHSHINIALLEVVLTKADQRKVCLMSLWMMLKTFLWNLAWYYGKRYRLTLLWLKLL